MVGTCFLTVSKEFPQLHSLPMCYLVVVVVVFNQMMCSFQVSSRKSERMCGQERAGLSSEKEDAIHSASLGPPQLCEKTSAAWHLLRSQEVGMV